jgi:hypothetical protein
MTASLYIIRRGAADEGSIRIFRRGSLRLFLTKPLEIVQPSQVCTPSWVKKRHVIGYAITPRYPKMALMRVE